MDVFSTAVAALIGAVLGSLGAVWLGGRIASRHEDERVRRKLARNHLIQLQDGLESLWYRLESFAHSRRRNFVDDEYFLTSSIYAIGNVLAQKRRLILAGAYPTLDLFGTDFGSDLEEALEQVEREIGREPTEGDRFYRYERLALADSMLVWNDDWRALSYTEAAARQTEAVTEPAKRFLSQLDVDRAKAVMEAIAPALELLSTATHIRNNISEPTDTPPTDQPSST